MLEENSKITRNAHIRAKTDLTLYTLTKADMQGVIAEYPSVEHVLREQMDVKLQVQMMDFMLQIMDVLLQMMNFVLQMMDFILKMMDWLSYRSTRLRKPTVRKRSF